LRWVKRVVAVVVALLLLTCAVVALYAWRSVPADSANYAVASPLGETTITLDADGSGSSK
jgi:uncharacterized protein YxeA